MPTYVSMFPEAVASRKSGFYLGLIVWEYSSEWPKATNFLGGTGGMPPGKFLK